MRTGGTVLIVEDDDDLRRMFRNALIFADFEMREAADGHIALIDIEQHRPALIVLDLGLPNINGYIVLQELTAQAHTRNIPVVVVTGQQALTHTQGVACLLRKPVTPDRLVNTVRGCIAAGSSPIA
jgi:DNA-binding response OmpR family regulator